MIGFRVTSYHEPQSSGFRHPCGGKADRVIISRGRRERQDDVNGEGRRRRWQALVSRCVEWMGGRTDGWTEARGMAGKAILEEVCDYNLNDISNFKWARATGFLA